MNDLISRRAAIDFINAGRLVNPNEPRWSDNEVVAFLKSRPSAERRGRWIENETSYADPPTKQTCNCSICGKASTRPLGDWCRWCGSRMDLDGDTE